MKRNEAGQVPQVTDCRATLIIPVRNGATTLSFLFESLEIQEEKSLIDKVIIIDDASTDTSNQLVENYKKQSMYHVELRTHIQPLGLAANYNEGIGCTTSEFFILVHQDVVLQDDDSFRRIFAPLLSCPDVVASRPVVLHPYDVWKTYSFWQKCLLSRHVDKKESALAGKFDGYRRLAFIQKIGLFDEVTFRTAGEDGDIQARLRKAGAIVRQADLSVVHLHTKEQEFGLMQLISKEAQHQESLGAVFRKHSDWRVRRVFVTLFRQLLVLSLAIPFLKVPGLLLIAAYSFLYTRRVYIEERGDPRVLALPFVNIALLFIDTYYFAKGLITGRQSRGL